MRPRIDAITQRIPAPENSRGAPQSYTPADESRAVLTTRAPSIYRHVVYPAAPLHSCSAAKAQKSRAIVSRPIQGLAAIAIELAQAFRQARAHRRRRNLPVASRPRAAFSCE